MCNVQATTMVEAGNSKAEGGRVLHSGIFTNQLVQKHKEEIIIRALGTILA